MIEVVPTAAGLAWLSGFGGLAAPMSKIDEPELVGEAFERRAEHTMVHGGT